MSVKVAGIDQSRKGFGWALGSDDSGAIPSWGVDDLSEAGSNEGLMYFLAAKRVRELIDRGAQKIFIETPIMMRHDNINQSMIKFGLQAAMMQACYECKVPYAWVDVNKWRERFLGFYKPPPGIVGQKARRSWFKETAKQQCFARGWLVQDDNAAEALGILDFGLASVSQAYKRRVGPIIRRAELRRMV